MPECCPPGLCAFSPLAVGFYRRIRGRCLTHGLDPVEAAASFIRAGEHLAVVILGAAGGGAADSPEQRWAALLADLARAEAAGNQTDAEISAFLCPLGTADLCYTAAQAQPCPERELGHGC